MQLFSRQQKQDVCVLELCNIQNFNHISRQSIQETFNPEFVIICVCGFFFLCPCLSSSWLQRGSSGSGERDLYVAG